ncbi:MAG: four helix bundle protein [Phycisphaerales bacterium]|nr:four helix bundle protein [Phycisphaerales bacterium]MCB9862359.1 four helix bundle protein [Phycisphaerales bacterium]
MTKRTFDFARSILDISTGFPNDPRGWVLAKQTIRSGTSIGANVREADNAFTDQDFAHKCSLARKEAAETNYWLKLAVAARLLPEESTMPLVDESDELARVLATIVQRTQANVGKKHDVNR